MAALCCLSAFAQSGWDKTSTQIAKEMMSGWNLGNTMRGRYALTAEDEAKRLDELDEQDQDDEKRGTLGNAERHGLEDVGKSLQTTRHDAIGYGEQDDTKGYQGYQTVAEGRGKEFACGREQDGMRHQREQREDGEINHQEERGYAEGDAITVC